MHNTNWEDINSLIKASFQNYDEIEPKNTRETKSDLLRLLQDLRVPLSPYLVNAICTLWLKVLIALPSLFCMQSCRFPQPLPLRQAILC